jgi:hypothetical protein
MQRAVINTFDLKISDYELGEISNATSYGE